MQAAAFLAGEGALDDQLRHLRQVAQLDQVTTDLVVAVELNGKRLKPNEDKGFSRWTKLRTAVLLESR